MGAVDGLIVILGNVISKGKGKVKARVRARVRVWGWVRVTIPSHGDCIPVWQVQRPLYLVAHPLASRV